MGTVNVVLGEDTRLNLILGQQLENAVTEVVFDFSAWQTTYGSGTLALSVQRPGDEMPYAVTLTTSGTDATWSVTNLDTAYKGVGHIQLTYTVGSAIKKSVVYKFTVYESLGANGEYPSPGQTWQEEMEQEITDVKADLAELQGGGVPTNVRQALKILLESAAYADTGLTDEMAVVSSWASAVTAITLNHSSISISGATTSQLTATTTPSGGTVTWSSSDTSVATVSSSGLVTGVSNGTATITATSGNVSATCSVTVSGIATLSSISAVYTQTGTIYDTDDLDDILTAGTLVVTATYSDSSTATVASTDYTLSGTLTEGTSTITVSYGGKTTTFNVMVTEAPATPLYDWDFTQGLIDSVSGVTAVIGGAGVSRDSDGIKFTGSNQYARLTDTKVTIADRTVIIDLPSAELSTGGGTNHARVFSSSANLDGNTASSSATFCYQYNQGWNVYTGSAWGTKLNSTTYPMTFFTIRG